MAKLTLQDVASGYQSAVTVNENHALIEAALENTVSRDGTTPNSMNADFDMNNHDVLNVGAIDVTSLTVAGVELTTSATALTDSQSAKLGYDTRSVSNATAAAALSNGTVIRMEGFTYEVDSTKTGTASATNDLGVNGLKPFGVPYPEHYGAARDGVTDDSAAFTAAQNNEVGVGLLPGTYLISTNLTVSMDLVFTPGAKLKVANTFLVTLAGDVEATLSQIFDLSAGGDIKFSKPQDVHPEWFGTSNTALQSAFKKSAAGSRILLQGIEYETVAIIWTNDPLSSDGDDTGKVIEGPTRTNRYKTTGEFYGARIVLADSQNTHMFSFDSGGVNEYGAGGLRNVTLMGNKAAQSAGSAVYVDDIKDIEFHNVDVFDFFSHGWNFEGNNNQIRFSGHCESWNNGGMGFRFASFGDIQSTGALVAVNNVDRGIYFAAGGGRLGHLYAYFNSRGVEFTDTFNNISVDFIRVEDNEEEGVFINCESFNIDSIQASDNGTASATGPDRSGVRLRPNASGRIGSVTASIRPSVATRQQEYLVYDESTGGVIIDHVDNSSYEYLELDYDALTAAFTVGETLTGGTSGATATIIKITETTATTGTLLLAMLSTVTFTDNETITDSATGSADVNGTFIRPTLRTCYFSTSATLTGARVKFRPSITRTYAQVKNSGAATVTPHSGTYGSYVITGISENMTITNITTTETCAGMEIDFSVSSSGSYNLNWGSDFLDVDGTALSATALTVGQTAYATFRRHVSKWILVQPIQVI